MDVQKSPLKHGPFRRKSLFSRLSGTNTDLHPGKIHPLYGKGPLFPGETIRTGQRESF